jgi:uncharacterized membrane protein
MARDAQNGVASAPMDRLKGEASGLISALGERAMSSVLNKVEGTAGRLTDYVEGGAGPGLMAAVTGAKDMAEGKGPVRSMLGAGVKGATEKIKGMFGKGGGKGGGKKLKVTNIVESIDVGVPIDVAYNQWTQFSDLSGFMKKVENVEQDQNEPQKVHWKAQVFWSHREWDAEIIEQTPEERIIWKSKGEKGHVDGAVTFHKLGPQLTRILVVLEYHPQGFFEHTGNLWRAQGRRVRLELKHFRRHAMTSAILHPDEIEGWRGVIEDGEVVQDHDEALEDSGAEDEYTGAEDEETGADDEYAEDEDAGADDEYAEDEDTGAEDEGDEVSRDGQAAERPARATGSTRPRRDRRAAGGPQRPSRSARAGERSERPVRRRAATRRET